MPPGRHLLQLAAGVGRVRHRPAVDREDDVARAERAGRRPSGSTSVMTAPVWPDGICSRRAIARRQVLQRQPEAAALLLLRLRLLLLLLRPARAVLLRLEIELVDRDVQRLLLLVRAGP